MVKMDLSLLKIQCYSDSDSVKILGQNMNSQSLEINFESNEYFIVLT